MNATAKNNELPQLKEVLTESSLFDPTKIRLQFLNDVQNTERNNNLNMMMFGGGAGG